MKETSNCRMEILALTAVLLLTTQNTNDAEEQLCFKCRILRNFLRWLVQWRAESKYIVSAVRNWFEGLLWQQKLKRLHNLDTA